ncbi:MAG TPA: hypothetical protein VGE07_07605 [Herpetosiphonaceae bacterium]
MIAAVLKPAAALIVAMAVLVGGAGLQAERPSPSAPVPAQSASLPVGLDPQVSWNS